MRNTIYLNNCEYEKATLLLELSNLFFLQREALVTGSSVSELLNIIINTHKETTKCVSQVQANLHHISLLDAI